MSICKICGKEAKEGHDECLECFRKRLFGDKDGVGRND